MKYKECNCQFSICERCNTSVFLGSSGAEHVLKCWHGTPVFASPGGGYLPWESPGGECPHCWHEKNGREEPILSESSLGQRIKSVLGV